MVFCNKNNYDSYEEFIKVTILILVDGFLQLINLTCREIFKRVTILILVDGFLQFGNLKIGDDTLISHNPYFSRWFSAM